MTDKKKNLVRDDPAEAGRRGGSIGGKRSRGGGRPKKYKTEAERLAAKRASALRSYHRRKNTLQNRLKTPPIPTAIPTRDSEA